MDDSAVDCMVAQIDEDIMSNLPTEKLIVNSEGLFEFVPYKREVNDE